MPIPARPFSARSSTRALSGPRIEVSNAWKKPVPVRSVAYVPGPLTGQRVIPEPLQGVPGGVDAEADGGAGQEAIRHGLRQCR